MDGISTNLIDNDGDIELEVYGLDSKLWLAE